VADWNSTITTSAFRNAEKEPSVPSVLSRLLGRHAHAAQVQVTLYTRAQCCCCHKALDVLKDAQRRFGFVIDEVDIDGDPGLVAKFDTEVPVITVGGKVRFRGVVNPALLERLLVAESRNQPPAPTGAAEG
jgi:glutaredoxin